MEILWNKGIVMLLLKLWQGSYYFSELEAFCRREGRGRGRTHLSVTPLSNKLNQLVEQGFVAREDLDQKFGEKFVRYSLTRQGMGLLELVLSKIHGLEDAQSVSRVTTLTDSFWNYGTFMILLIFWEFEREHRKSENKPRLSFNEILRRCNKHKGDLFSSGTLSRKLTVLRERKMIQKKNEREGRKTTKYSLGKAGREVLAWVIHTLQTPPALPAEEISTEISKKIPEEEGEMEVSIESPQQGERSLDDCMKALKGALVEALKDVLSPDFFEEIAEAKREIHKRVEQVLREEGIRFTSGEHEQEFKSRVFEEIVASLEEGRLGPSNAYLPIDVVVSEFGLFSKFEYSE